MSEQIVFIFDLDDTLLMSNEYNSYNDINFNKTLYDLLNSYNYDKYIYTNGTMGHARHSIPKLLKDIDIKGVYARDTIPSMKPHFSSFNHVNNDIFYKYRYQNYLDLSCIFFDDILDNIKTAKYCGWKTVWIPNRMYTDKIKNKKFKYVDYQFNNIYEALTNINNIINNI